MIKRKKKSLLPQGSGSIRVREKELSWDE